MPAAPADPFVRKARKRNGGNTGKSFTEGWVEFEDKKVAKRVVAMLNGNAIGGKRRSAYHYDLWNLKYLPKFKWDQLTEEIGGCRFHLSGCLLATIGLSTRVTAAV